MPVLEQSCLAAILAALPSIAAAAAVSVQIDNTAPLQAIDGFGATHISLVFGTRDNLTAGQRARAVKAVYGDVGLTLGNVEGNLLESPGDYSLRANDNPDPAALDWKGFQTEWADNLKAKILDPAKPYGFTGYSLAQKINVRWSSPWLNDLKAGDYQAYLAECAEQVAAGALYNRDKLGLATPYLWLYNEPLDGNQELQGSVQDLVEIVKAAGARLRREGFANVKFVAPNSETVSGAIAQASAILADPEARPYLGVIGYHCYPYGSAYASVPRILAASGQGNPDAAEISGRRELAKLARQYGLPLWMTEVSHGEVAYDSFDGLRGRAIHIHDEFLYAGASAFFGMNNLWDETAQQEHFGAGSVFDEGDTFALIENAKDSVHISATGYAVGHYARWIRKGAVLLPSTVSDAKVQVSAFRDDRQGRLVLVIINNTASPQTLGVKLKGLALASGQPAKGEQSTAAGFWKSLAPAAPEAADAWTLEAPAMSVVSVSAALGPSSALRPRLRSIRGGERKGVGADGRFRNSRPRGSRTEMTPIFPLQSGS